MGFSKDEERFWESVCHGNPRPEPRWCRSPSGHRWRFNYDRRLLDRQAAGGERRNLAVADGDGRIVKLALELEKRLREVQAALEASQAAVREKELLLATLAHELRAPLSSVLLAARLLADREDLPAEAREEVRIVLEGAELQARLIADLMDLSSLERGASPIRRETVDVHDLLRRTADVFLFADRKEKAHDLVFRLEARDRCVSGDPVRLQQVFSNLLRNAVKFTPPGGRIEVRTFQPAAGSIAIEVIDSGIGIDPSAVQRIFHPLERPRQGGGLGLGLSIARSIAAAHGGTIWARSDGEGKGAAFTVELPLAV